MTSLIQGRLGLAWDIICASVPAASVVVVFVATPVLVAVALELILRDPRARTIIYATPYFLYVSPLVFAIAFWRFLRARLRNPYR